MPNPGPDPDDPLFYVNELYGTIKVVTNDFTVSDYATGLLNFDPTGAFPGSGEQGLAGLVVDPVTGDLFVTRVTDTDGIAGGAHHPQVVRLHSNDGGRTASTVTVILNMVGESQGQSHQVSNATIGPDGKLYVHNGDGFDASTALNLNSYRGKILRMNLDGTRPDRQSALQRRQRNQSRRTISMPMASATRSAGRGARATASTTKWKTAMHSTGSHASIAAATTIGTAPMRRSCRMPATSGIRPMRR